MKAAGSLGELQHLVLTHGSSMDHISVAAALVCYSKLAVPDGSVEQAQQARHHKQQQQEGRGQRWEGERGQEYQWLQEQRRQQQQPQQARHHNHHDQQQEQQGRGQRYQQQHQRQQEWQQQQQPGELKQVRVEQRQPVEENSDLYHRHSDVHLLLPPTLQPHTGSSSNNNSSSSRTSNSSICYSGSTWTTAGAAAPVAAPLSAVAAAVPGPPPALALLLHLLQLQLPNFAPRQIANCLHALARLQHRDRKLISQLLAAAQPCLLSFSFREQELANMMWALGRLRCIPGDSWVQGGRGWLPGWFPATGKGLVRMRQRGEGEGGEWRSRSSSNSSSSGNDVDERSERRRRNVNSSSSERELASTLSSSSRISTSSSRSLALARSCPSNSLPYSPQELANMCWGLGRLKILPPKPWLEALLQAALQNLQDFSPQQLSNLVWGLASMRGDNGRRGVPHGFVGCLLPVGWLREVARVAAGKVGGFSSQEVACLLWGLVALQAGNSAMQQQQQQQLPWSEGNGEVQHQQEKREQLLQQHQQHQRREQPQGQELVQPQQQQCYSQQQQEQLLQQLCHLLLRHLLLQPRLKLNPFQLRMSLQAATALCCTLPRYLLQPAFQLLLQSASHCYSYVPGDVCYTLLLLARAGYKPVEGAGEQEQLLELFYEQLSTLNLNSGAVVAGQAGRAGGAAGITTRVLCMQGELLRQWGLKPGSVWAAAYREVAEHLLPEMGGGEQRCVLGVLAWLQLPVWKGVTVTAAAGGGGAGGNGAGAAGVRGGRTILAAAARDVIGQGRVG